jgi:HAD superfamily hydrolase (TIGR01509 family)
MSTSNPRPHAVAFDLNGTLSDDEGLYFEIFEVLFAREGRPITRQEYFEQLVGNTDEAAIRLWLGDGYPNVERLLEERLELFLERSGDGRTVSAPVREAVAAAARLVPVAVVTGAFRLEAEHILRGAGLADHVVTVVALDDVSRSKPDPEPYLLAASRLGVAPAEVLAFEDTAVGVRSAKAAGLGCIGVLGTQDEAALHEADDVVDRLDLAVIQRLLA